MSRHMQHLPLVLALAGAAALSACAGDPALSDRIIENQGAEGFLDRIAQNCGKLSVGNQQLDYLINESDDNTYFIDESSKLYFGKVDRATYSTDINAFFPTDRNQPALDCIFEQLGQ